MIANRKKVPHTYQSATLSSQQYWEEFAASSNGSTGNVTTTHSRPHPTSPTVPTSAPITDVPSKTSLGENKPLGYWQNNRDDQHEQRQDTRWARQVSLSPPPTANDETGKYYFKHETTIHLETSDPTNTTMRAPHSPHRPGSQTQFEISSHTVCGNATNPATSSSSQPGTASGQAGVESGRPALQSTSGESHSIAFSANGLDISKARPLLRLI